MLANQSKTFNLLQPPVPPNENHEPPAIVAVPSVRTPPLVAVFETVIVPP
jgi:hypothetical protein